MANRLGIDLGGTKIEAIIIDDQFQVIERKRTLTLRDEGYDAILQRIIDLSKEMIKIGKIDSSIGICTPGTIEASGLPVLMENDANCFALAEATIGAAKKFEVVFGVILGTGCGAGIVVNKKIHRGPNRIAGEWGHHTLYQGGRDCYCGSQGCTESYISGTALEKEWKELSGSYSSVTDIIDNKLYESNPEWKENFMNNFGLALANVIDILDPDVVVLGGGLSKVDMLYTEGLEAAYKKSFSDVVVSPIIKNKLGDSSGVFGAAMIMDHI